LGFLHGQPLTDKELEALKECVNESATDKLVAMLSSEVLAQKHDIHRHFSEALSRIYIEMSRLSEVDPLSMIDGFDLVKTRLESSLFTASPETKAKPDEKVDRDYGVLDWKNVICPKCGRRGVIKPIKRKRGYKVKILYYCYHSSNKKRCCLKLSERIELKKHLTEKQVKNFKDFLNFSIHKNNMPYM